jgi:hypothetical protein
MWHGQIEGTDIIVLDPRFKNCFAGHVRAERLWSGGALGGRSRLVRGGPLSRLVGHSEQSHDAVRRTLRRSLGLPRAL